MIDAGADAFAARAVFFHAAAAAAIFRLFLLSPPADFHATLFRCFDDSRATTHTP